MEVECEACEVAATHPLTCLYQSNCDECHARLLAQGPAAYRAKLRDPTPLRKAMVKRWGERGSPEYLVGAERVKHWTRVTSGRI